MTGMIGCWSLMCLMRRVKQTIQMLMMTITSTTMKGANEMMTAMIRNRNKLLHINSGELPDGGRAFCGDGASA
jgi:hypothetical protein